MLADASLTHGTLVGALRDAARRWPDRVAWTFDPGDRFTFADVERLTAGYAATLRERGVRSGDRIAVLLGNRPAFPLTWLSLTAIGAVLVPVSTRYQTADAEHVLRACNASGIVAGPEFEPLLARLPPDVPGLANIYPAGAVEAAAAMAGDTPLPGSGDPDPAGTANIQFTSGTTGHPKGCVLPHRYWTQLAGGLVTDFPYLTASDVMLTAQPFHYIDPQWNVAAGLLSGAELVILDGFHPSSFWAKVRQHQVTYFYCLGAMPTLLLRMPASPQDREHRVRAVQCSAIPKSLHRDLEERWGVPWYETFGMMDGYLDDPAATAAATRGGWFHTGDLGRMDEQGRVYHTGRLKDMIRRSGENVAAREVEEILLIHPAVRLVAVCAVPDEIRGEEVKAYYVAPGTAPAELAEYCRARLAPFKVPRFWQAEDDLPRTDSQRVAKARLGELTGPVFDVTTSQWSGT